MERIWAPWRMKYILKARNEKEKCIFCEIPNEKKDEENYLIKRGKLAFVLMNIFPYNNGHLMIAPYKHTPSLQNLSEEELLEMMKLVVESEKALKALLSPDGFNIGLNIGRVAGAGFEEHVHIHIVPRFNGDTNFMPIVANTKVISESLMETYKKLKEVWPS
jgi:ATP adenylyltransferase